MLTLKKKKHFPLEYTDRAELCMHLFIIIYITKEECDEARYTR